MKLDRYDISFSTLDFLLVASLLSVNNFCSLIRSKSFLEIDNRAISSGYVPLIYSGI
jgi:hypothetical protein